MPDASEGSQPGLAAGHGAIELARLDRWRAHLVASRVTVPECRDFLAFGRLSTLERLRPVLAAAAPEQCGPLRAALQQLRKEKKPREGSKATGGRPGPAPEYSVERNQLPAEIRRTLDRMTDARRHRDACGKVYGKRKPPAMSCIRDMTWILRCLAKSCLDRGLPVELRKKTIRAWLDDVDARCIAARGVALQIGLLRRFLQHHLGKASKLVRRLASLRKCYEGRDKGELKHKEKYLLANPKTLGEIWNTAKILMKDGLDAPAGSQARQRLLREAAALALAIVAPLRISDLHRIRIGVHLKRTADHWSLKIRTRKTGADYARDELWPELTPFLDALIEVDASGGELWRGFDAREGTPLFTTDFGATGLSGDWISDVWEEHVGCGAHIVRTLWHLMCFEGDADKTWVALALCGQASERTADEYTLEGTRKRVQRNARRLLRMSRAAVPLDL